MDNLPVNNPQFLIYQTKNGETKIDVPNKQLVMNSYKLKWINM